MLLFSSAFFSKPQLLVGEDFGQLRWFRDLCVCAHVGACVFAEEGHPVPNIWGNGKKEEEEEMHELPEGILENSDAALRLAS
ncbi:hypothetical protein FDECE_12398 [Fusarium decemcellulare]|nr:hypothetical protein FDECE_12398 [Fusarium decemcellulare]